MTHPHTEQARRGKRFHDLINEVMPHIEEIHVATLKQWQTEGKAMTVIDTREPQEMAQGMIDGALPIPRGVLELQLDQAAPNQDEPLVLYCGGGYRSALAAHTAQIMGYEKVVSLAGGYKAWMMSQ